MSELNCTMRAVGGLPKNCLTQYPSGRWGFVGRVDARLAYQQIDGSPATGDQLRRAASFGVGLMKNEIKGRSWETREAAEQAAAELEVADNA